jgi:uncharacterized membrane protein
MVLVMSNSNTIILQVLNMVLLLAIFSCNKDNTPSPPGDEKLFPQVKTIIETNCTISCHAPSKGFNTGLPVILETDSDIVNHAAAIKAAVADPVSPTNKRMPEGGALSAADIDIITQWYESGGTINI